MRGERQNGAVIGACVLIILLSGSPGFSASGFDANRAYRDLVKQCDFGPRVPNTKAHEQCGDWLVAQLRPLADSVARQDFTCTVEGRRLRLTNIIATFNPRGQEHVLLTSHWDSRPRADRDRDPAKRDEAVPGANDGASGVAILLEIARVLKAHPPRQKVTIALLDGEDYGRNVKGMFLGSRYFAAHYQGGLPKWGVLLDMVGDKNLRLPIEANSDQRAPLIVDRVWTAAARANAPAFVRELGPAISDDHLALLDAGISCIDVIDFTYPYWHTTADTPDKCSAASLGQVGRTVLEALR